MRIWKSGSHEEFKALTVIYSLLSNSNRVTGTCLYYLLKQDRLK